MVPIFELEARRPMCLCRRHPLHHCLPATRTIFVFEGSLVHWKFDRCESLLLFVRRYRLSAADFDAYREVISLWNGTVTAAVNFRNATSSEWAQAHVKSLVAAMDWIPLGPLLAIEVGNGAVFTNE